MRRDRRELLLKIMALDFTALELNLYLDTHPRDARALEDYNRVTQELFALRQEYQECYGPLIHFGHGFSKFPWQWIEEPWPWEMTF
ncbi:MAG: spore coat protein CotJB [bacterium]|jgi:spore coat protein JB|nr:spore coat protein CotJB [Bacillota bacterium]